MLKSMLLLKPNKEQPKQHQAISLKNKKLINKQKIQTNNNQQKLISNNKIMRTTKKQK